MGAITTRRELLVAGLVVTVWLVLLFTVGSAVPHLDTIRDRPFAAIGVVTGFLAFLLFSFLRGQ